MSNTFTFKDTIIGVGDKVKVYQRIMESGKSRKQVFAGMVLTIKGDEKNRTFSVRRVGEQNIGIEKIFSTKSPTLTDIEVTKQGVKGTKSAKLYYTRKKSKREIDKIYSRQKLRK
ncbi:MAG TPA: 50S ribosomal protein L19 [Patescibacteria group bacterium]|nr:50S ribosomal protein L19 [Patescibacteria group bacterium]